MEQLRIPCIVYRGGTSRGIFFHKEDLPLDFDTQKHIFLSGIGSIDASQINGLGNGTSHTSKCVVISRSDREGIDVDYTFYQLGIGEEIVDEKGTCGNLSSAAGAFAVDEELVHVTDEPYKVVTVYNTNTNSILKIKVPLEKGKAKIKGDYLIPGLLTSGAKIEVDFIDPSGGTTASIFPMGKINRINLNGNSLSYTFVDVVNCYLFLQAESIGLTGIEPNDMVQNNKTLMEKINRIRDQVTVDVGIAIDIQDARVNFSAIPKIGYVAPPQDYVTNSGVEIKKEEYDIHSRMISMKRVHRTYAGSGLLSLAAAVFIEGTIPNGIIPNVSSLKNKGLVRIGHADGVVEIRCKLKEDGQDVELVGFDRTARRIIQGELLVPEKN